MDGRIDLNSIQYDEKLTSDLVLTKVADIDVFRHYLGDEFLNVSPIKSPLRRDDIPSFSVFYGSRNGRHMFNDFGSDLKGDCFKFVQLLFGLDNYLAGVEKVAADMGLVDTSTWDKSKRKVMDLSRLIRKDKVHIGIKSRKPQKHDKDFWARFGITPAILQKYNVKAISHLFIRDKVIVMPKYCYAYLEMKDGVSTYKIYQPFNKDHKFINNNDYSVWEGWTQLPKTGDLLIITSGRKDVMSIASTTVFNAIALQSESVLPKEHIIDQLKQRFNNIVVFYDNDQYSTTNNGREYGAKLASAFDMTQIEIPDVFNSKDYSDLVSNHGIETAADVLTKLIYG